MNRHFILRPAAAAVVISVLLAGCANMSEREQGTAKGAGIGALGGAVIGAVTGNSAGTGAVIGGAVGAVAGNLWSKRMEDRRKALEASTQGTGINLSLGTSFLGLYKMPNPGRVDHVCLGVANYEVNAMAAKLEAQGIKATIRKDKPEVYFNDPDGIRFQLENKDYRG